MVALKSGIVDVSPTSHAAAAAAHFHLLLPQGVNALVVRV